DGSVMLPTGDVLVVGGEYTDPAKPLTPTHTNQGELYDAASNQWLTTVAPFAPSQISGDPKLADDFADGSLELLSNGKVLASYINGPETYLYDPATGSWQPAG